MPADSDVDTELDPVRPHVRSWLYVPGDEADKLTKAAQRGADALIVDLEDAVVPAAKADARVAVAEWARAIRPAGQQVWVRVNNDEDLEADVTAIAGADVDGIVLPKADLGSLQRLRDAIDAAGVAIDVAVLVETARSLAKLDALVSNGAVRIALGEADLGADLGLDPSPDGREWWPYRARVVMALAAARLEPPWGPVETNFRNLDAFRESTEALRRAGFGGRAAIHPDQVAVINDVFTPTPRALAQARDIVARFEAAALDGSGVAVDGDGRMIDRAVVRAARRLLG